MTLALQIQRTSPATTRSIRRQPARAARRARRCPRARPRTTPAGESHSTRAPRQRRREPAPGAQNSIEPSGTQIGVPLAERRKNLGEHQRAIGGPARFGLDRRRTRRELRRIRGRLQIDAEPDHDELQRARLHGRLRENAGELAPADQHIVRPLDLRRQSGHGAHGFGNRHAAGERQQRGRIALRRAIGRRPDDHRHVQPGARRRKPDAPMTPAPRGLRLRHNGGALFGAGLGKARGDVVGRGRRFEPVDAAAHAAGALDATRAIARATSAGTSHARSSHDWSGRFDFKADVDRRRRMSQRTDRRRSRRRSRRARECARA